MEFFLPLNARPICVLICAVSTPSVFIIARNIVSSNNFKSKGKLRDIFGVYSQWFWHNWQSSAWMTMIANTVKIAKIYVRSCCCPSIANSSFFIFVFHWNFTMTVFLVHAPRRNNVQKNYSRMWKWNPLTERRTHTPAPSERERFPGGQKFKLASIHIHIHGERCYTNKVTNFYEWKIIFT